MRKAPSAKGQTHFFGGYTEEEITPENRPRTVGKRLSHVRLPKDDQKGLVAASIRVSGGSREMRVGASTPTEVRHLMEAGFSRPFDMGRP
jgi:hypothetical protein